MTANPTKLLQFGGASRAGGDDSTIGEHLTAESCATRRLRPRKSRSHSRSERKCCHRRLREFLQKALNIIVREGSK